jgi:uncharacterized SAM-binding protein YcdF (DUF218 family)
MIELIFGKPTQGAAGLLFLLGFAFCLFFGLIPPLIYGIWNSGVAVLLLSAPVFWFLLRIWEVLSPSVRRGIALLLLSALVVGGALSIPMARQAWFSPPPPGKNLPVVVLGGGIRGDRPSLMLARRLWSAALYLKENSEAICVVSGGQGPDEDYPEAQVMAAYLEELGISPHRIWQEAGSSNTRENLKFSQKMLKERLPNAQEIVLVTDGFHQLRAAFYAAHVGLKAYSIPSSTPWGLLPSYWLREWMALSAAWVTVNLTK